MIDIPIGLKLPGRGLKPHPLKFQQVIPSNIIKLLPAGSKCAPFKSTLKLQEDITQ